MLDRTLEFRRSVQEKRKFLSEEKRAKASSTRRSAVDRNDEQNTLLSSKEFNSDAYNILKHINTLLRMLNSIRRPYLNIDSSNTFISRHTSRNLDLGASHEQWTLIRYLTNEERDQIDLQARIILSRCADKVKEMEALEKRRAELLSRNSNPLLRLLPSRLIQDSTHASSEFLSAHHAGIAWFLNRRLAEASRIQKEMQEERIKRQMAWTRTLGSGAAKEAIDIEMKGSLLGEGGQSHARNGGWLDSISRPSNLTSGLASSFASTLTGSSSPSDSTQPIASNDPSVSDDDIGLSDDETDEMELTPSQILQFETENANILRSMQDTLASVQLAESRLLDISALQMELVTRLTQQTEITEQLHEDAIATSVMVDQGNLQLREARRRGKDGRMFIILFLFGASFALLFVHHY